MLACFTFLLLILHWATEASEVPLGVPFSALSAYRIGEPFKCLQSPLSIPWSKVNDDYCDCPDGSDEPGTSACGNGVFFCKDVQYKVVSIPSSFVNDEVIDCCDGSDEHDGRTEHTPTCSVLAEAHQQARIEIERGVNEGHRIFKEYIETLRQRQEQHQQQLEEELAAQKAAAESGQADPANQAPLSPGEIQPDSPIVPPSAPEAQPHESSAETPVPESQTEHPEIPPGESDPEAHHGDEAEGEKTPHESEPTPEPTPVTPPPIDYGPEGAFRMLMEDPGYLEFSDKQYTYRFYPFDKIYQRNKGSEWSSSDTSLGRWTDWAYADSDLLRENKYAIMRFEDGQGCWNGPSRSVRVSVYCDAKNEIKSVEEPSRCVYTMRLHTPAACFESPDVILRRYHQEL